MINFTAVLIYTLTAILYNSTPGPVIMLVTGTRLTHDLKHTVWTIFGANLGSVTLMLVAIFALLGIADISENFLNILKVLGCCYLIWLSVRSIISRIKSYFIKKVTNDIKILKKVGGFKQGYLVGVSNPKDTMFFVSFFPQFMNVSVSHITSMIILGIIWTIFDWLILLSYATIVSRVISQSFEKVFMLAANFFILVIAIFGLKDIGYYFLA